MNRLVEPHKRTIKKEQRKQKRKEMYPNRRKKILLSICSIILIIVLAFAFFPVQITSFIMSLFMQSAPLTTPDSAASLFESIDVNLESPVALEGLSIIPVDHSSLNISNNKSTSKADAAALVQLARQNLESIEKWGIFMDIFSPNNSLGSGKLEGVGTVATQFVKIQDRDNFFLNEGFALVEFEFLSADNSFLAQILRDEINGGCRILTDTDNDKKYIQWVPKNGASYDPETKLISTALLSIGTKTISEDPESESYNREKEFEDLLPIDITAQTIDEVTITYNPSTRIYTLDIELNIDAINANQISAGVIKSLFGDDLVRDIAFSKSSFVIEIWDNGLFKSIRGTQDWTANLVIELLGAEMKLATRAPETKTDFYFSYSNEDCAIESIKQKYYANTSVIE